MDNRSHRNEMVSQKQDVNFSWNQKEFWNEIFHPEGTPKIFIPPRTWCNICGKDYELYRTVNGDKFTKTCICDENACPRCEQHNCERH